MPSIIRGCEYVEQFVDMAGPDGLGGDFITMRCTERASWIIVVKGYGNGVRFCFRKRYCRSHATTVVNQERDMVHAGLVKDSAIKVIDPFTDMAITVYVDRPHLGTRYVVDGVARRA